jgi:hypothetical protein
MKKIILLQALIVFAFATHAQIGRPTKIVKKITAPPPNNTPVMVTPYYLCSAKVDIYTGNDNKELPSIVNLNLYRLSKSRFASAGSNEPTLMFNYMMQGNNKQEFKPNSNNQVVLTNLYSFPYTFPGGTGDGYRYSELDLTQIQINGLRLRIDYSPNFILDAWKIEKVILTLEFKDLNGNPHPTMATVTIPFLNASALLKEGNYTLTCEADKFLMPKN